MSIFEATMMVCWGASWPMAVVKTYKTKDVNGKSIIFLWLIITGYICGIIHKILYNFDMVIWLYMVNLAFVAADTFFYYRYKNRTLNIAVPVYENTEKFTTVK